jgi:hypothetical protein
VLCLACDRAQARIVLNYIRGYFAKIPMLAALVERETAEGLDLTTNLAARSRYRERQETTMDQRRGPAGDRQQLGNESDPNSLLLAIGKRQRRISRDSPLEGTGFELAVPRRNESRDRPVLLALCGLADDERRLVLARYPPRVVTLSLCRRRHKAADLGREQPGEFDRCRVLARRPDDLQGDR